MLTVSRDAQIGQGGHWRRGYTAVIVGPLSDVCKHSNG